MIFGNTLKSQPKTNKPSNQKKNICSARPNLYGVAFIVIIGKISQFQRGRRLGVLFSVGCFGMSSVVTQIMTVQKNTGVGSLVDLEGGLN